ncbi:MAG: MBL fold metallo-hydrolase [Acidobacteriaceae bacterium]
MMKMTVLASGSKGNSTLVSTGRTRILVDAGLSCRELLNRMRAAGEDPEALTAILISHEHLDHINGLSVLARKLRIPVYFTEPTHRAWARMMSPRTTMSYAKWMEMRRLEMEAKEMGAKEMGAKEMGAKAQAASPAPGIAVFPAAAVDGPAALPDLTEAAQDMTGVSLEASSEEIASDASLCDLSSGDEEASSPVVASSRTRKAPAAPFALPAVEYFQAGSPFCIGDIAINPYTIPHDAADPVGFVFEAEGMRMAIATDLGYMPPNVRLALRRCDVLMIESNHDLEMLRDGPYPWSVKQRVLSRVGHLSNNATAEFLSGEYDGAATYIVLAHLSERNNLPELARLSAESALQGRASLLANRVLLARQDAALEPICL